MLAELSFLNHIQIFFWIVKTVEEQKRWLEDAQRVFSIEVLSITDENEVFNFMENKSRYQQELTERCHLTQVLYEKINRIGYRKKELIAQVNSINNGQEKLSKLSLSQDRRFENEDKETEETYYEKVEGFIAWIGSIKEKSKDNEDIAVIFTNHNALVKDIEIKALDLTAINNLGNDLVNTTLWEEKRLAGCERRESLCKS